MDTHDDIDSVLSQAQAAVDSLAKDVGSLAGTTTAPQITAEESSSADGDTAGTIRPDNERLQHILKLEVPVIVRVAERSIATHEIMKIAPGTILEFDRAVDSDLDLLVNNHPIGSGVAVKVNERFGLRISRVGNIKQRVHSLGAS